MVLDALDIFAFPSLCETLGFALLEAMATEIPAVGSAVGGVPEVIVHGETGLLVPPRNSAALAGALQQLFSSPANREQMGRAGRQRVKECFLESTCVTKTIAVYRQMLGVAGPGISQHN
jgi:glycosyltransferase involved in cell wall biosynthesis